MVTARCCPASTPTGWPRRWPPSQSAAGRAGIVGRRDGAIVALIAAAGLPGPETAGACPACALTRWWRVAVRLGSGGWRAVRADLADHGEIPAGDQTSHDCALPLDRPAGPLFCPIDRHGAPGIGRSLSTRSLTAIVAARLDLAEPAEPDPWPNIDLPARTDRTGGDHEWAWPNVGSPDSGSSRSTPSSMTPNGRRRPSWPGSTPPLDQTLPAGPGDDTGR